MNSMKRAPFALGALTALLLIMATPPATAWAESPQEETDGSSMISVVSSPALTGTQAVGSTLTVTGGVWSEPDVTITYSWSSNDGCCSGGPLDTTGPSHVITAQDSYAGFVGVTVTASKDGFEPASVYLGTDRIQADVPAAPVSSAAALTAANRGTVTATSADSVATISIPGTGPGIQFYVYGYAAPTRLGFHVTIDPQESEFQPAYDIQVDYSALGPGLKKLAVLTTSGDLVGWVQVGDVALPPPVESVDALTSANDGDVSAQRVAETEVLVGVPGAEPGDSVFVTGFSEPTALGWYIVDANRQIRVDLSSLPAGSHTLVISDAEGRLLGWAPVVVGAVLAQTGGAISPLVGAAGLLLVVGGLGIASWSHRARKS